MKKMEFKKDKYKKANELSKELIIALEPFETVCLSIPIEDSKYDYSIRVEKTEKINMIINKFFMPY